MERGKARQVDRPAMNVFWAENDGGFNQNRGVFLFQTCAKYNHRALTANKQKYRGVHRNQNSSRWLKYRILNKVMFSEFKRK